SFFDIVEYQGRLGINKTNIEVEDPIVYASEIDNGVAIVTKEVNEKPSYTVNIIDVVSSKTNTSFTISSPPKGIVEMDDGIWVGTIVGLFFYSYDQNRLIRYGAQYAQLSNPHITAVIKSKRQPVIWIGTNEGLAKNDYYSSKFSYTDVYKCSNVEFGNVLKTIKDGHGGYWLSLLRDLYYREDESHDFKKITLGGFLENNQSRVDPIYSPYTDKVYVLTKRNLYEYDLDRSVSKCVYTSHIDLYTQTIHLFGEKLVWVDNKGVSLFDTKNYTHRHKNVVADGKDNVSPKSISTPEGDSILWIVNGKEPIIEYNVNTGITNTYEFSAFDLANDLWVKSVKVLRRNGQRELWVLTSYGLFYYLPDCGKVQKIEYSPFFSNTAQVLFTDIYDNVWVGSEYGLACVNNTDGRVYEYSNSMYRIPKKLQNYGVCECADGSVVVTGDHAFVEFSVNNFATNDYFPSPKVVRYQYMDAQSMETDSLTRDWIVTTSDSVISVPEGVRSVKLATRILNYSKTESN
ncbi:MAG: hypothetical protein Q4C30_01040, partial [Bacteroidia bacterium]|nr:hypothetical protein [Bacteroidia bacterium]